MYTPVHSVLYDSCAISLFITDSRSIDSNLIISVPLAMLFVLVISVGVVVIGLVCLRNMKGRDSKKRNLQSIERA